MCSVQSSCFFLVPPDRIAADRTSRGAKAHESSRDESDEQKVITVGFYSARGTRVESGHAHEDGTFKHWPSRAGRR